jgi:DNA-binding response OmpR family regulator
MRSFAILLTDCHMPNMDGYELAQTIRNSEEGTDIRLPIVAVTASVMKEEVDQCIDAGMDDCLAKPLEMDKLKVMLQKHMPESVAVRRHINWNTERSDLKEDLVHLVCYFKRRICGIASAGPPLFSV